MERKTALIGAALMTGVIAIAFLFLSTSADGQTSTIPISPPATESAESFVVPMVAEPGAAFAAREAAMLDQIELRQAAINDLDTSYEAQLDALTQRLEDANQSLLDASEKIDSLQKQGEQIQTEIMDTDQAFQVELNGLQTQLANEDAQIRQQLEPIYAQLQLAYDQIAANQAYAAQANAGQPNVSQVANDGNSQTNPPANQEDNHGDDNHDEGDHDEGEHHEGDHDDDEHDD